MQSSNGFWYDARTAPNATRRVSKAISGPIIKNEKASPNSCRFISAYKKKRIKKRGVTIADSKEKRKTKHVQVRLG